jgi:putative addiction module component (TIGR02574 family)
MAHMTPELSRLLDEASMLPLDEQAALAQSLIANLEGKMDEDVRAAWDEEIKRRVAELDSGAAKTIPWEEVRERNLKKLPHAR